MRIARLDLSAKWPDFVHDALVPQFQGTVAIEAAWTPHYHQRVNRRFHAILEVELSQDVFQVPLNRGRADAQPRGNFFVGFCLSD